MRPRFGPRRDKISPVPANAPTASRHRRSDSASPQGCFGCAQTISTLTEAVTEPYRPPIRSAEAPCCTLPGRTLGSLQCRSYAVAVLTSFLVLSDTHQGSQGPMLHPAPFRKNSGELAPLVTSLSSFPVTVKGHGPVCPGLGRTAVSPPRGSLRPGEPVRGYGVATHVSSPIKAPLPRFDGALPRPIRPRE